MKINNYKVISLFLFSSVILMTIVVGVFAQSSNDWVRVRNGRIPGDAVVGGQERSGYKTFVCRAKHRGNYYSGRAEGNRCYFNPGSSEISARRFEVLTGKYDWKKSRNYQYAVISGSDSEENFYVCRVWASGGTYSGRLTDGRCFYTRQNRGYSSSRYEILQGKRTTITIVQAASRGDYREVKGAIENGQAINLRDSNGKTALMVAAEKGYDRIVQELVYERAGINYRDEKGNSALMLAARNGRLAIVRDLMREGAEVKARNHEDDTAFTLAASGGHLEIVDDFMRDQNFYGGVTQIDTEKAFRNAAYYGHADVLQTLLNYGVSLESPDSFGVTALMNAARGGKLETVRFLLDKDANINAQDDRNSWTALLYAVNANSEKVLRVFFDEKELVKAGDETAEKALHLAAEKDKRKSLKFLLLKGVNVNSKSVDQDWTALMFAARNGNNNIGKTLISIGVDLNAKNHLGETALMLAAANSKNKMTKLLIKSGADINLRDNNGMTALGWAIQNKHKDTRKTLKKAKAKQ